MDFSSIGATPAQTGKIDFSAIGGIPAVGQDEPTDDTTALGAAGRGAVGMLPLGNQAYSAIAGAAEKKPYVQERQELEKEIQADIASHEPSRLVGQAAGLVAPAVLTGGASAPESLLDAAGQGAAVGAGFGAGNAIDTLSIGGSGAKAAGDVALGAGLGAAGGAIGQKIAGAAESAVPGIENYAAKKAAQSVGMGSDELGNMSQQELIDTGKMLMDKGIVKQGASTQQMFDQAKALQENYGDTIGQIGSQAHDLGLSTDTKPLLEALKSKYQAADALQNPDERKAAVFYKRGMADILSMASQNPSAEGEAPTQITFDQLQRLKKSYGNSAFENGAVKNPAAADVYSQLNAGQKSIVAAAKDNPELPDQLRDAMTGYSKMHPVVDGLQDVLGRERAGNMPAKGFGMMGKLVGQLPGQGNPTVNALTSLGLMGAGHPLWAVGAATATLQNPRAMSSMAQGAAEAIPGIAEKLPLAGAQVGAAAAPSAQNMGATKPVRSPSTPQASKSAPTTLNVNHPELAPWKQTFQKNAASAKNQGEVQKSQAVTDFILSQRDPAYAKAKQSMTDNPVGSGSSTDLNMAEGGTVPEPNDAIDEPIPALGSTLEGFHTLLTNKQDPALVSSQPGKGYNDGMDQVVPLGSPLDDTKGKGTPSKDRQFRQPFNPDFSDKLKAFVESQKEKTDAQSR